MSTASVTHRRLGAGRSVLVVAGLVLGMTACTDFVVDRAPEGCGFPPDAELVFSGLASPLDLGVGDAPVDRGTRVDAYVTEGPVYLPGHGSSRAICLVLSDDPALEYWVRPVADDWEYVGR